MRPKERIPIVLKHIDWKIFLNHIMGSDYSVDMLIEAQNELSAIENFWLSNPDLRLTQVLVNLNIIPNKPGGWYYMEESTFLIQHQKVPLREVLLWGTYGKSQKDPLKYVLIKDMSNDHIDNVLLNVKDLEKNKLYYNAFIEEREYRRVNKIIITDE